MTETSLQKQEQKILEFPDQAKLIIVHNRETLDSANDFLSAVKGLIREVRDTFNPIVDKTHKAHKEAVTQKKKYETPLLEAERIIKLQIGTYLLEQEKIRKKAEEKAEKEAEERQRLTDEKLKKAQAVAQAGDVKEAARIVDEEIPEAPPYEPLPEVPEIEGTSVRQLVKWRCTNIKIVPRNLLMLDSVKITKLGVETKGKAQVPGIEFFLEASVAKRDVGL